MVAQRREQKVQRSESEAIQRDFLFSLQGKDLFTKKTQMIQLGQSAYFYLTKQE